MAYYFIFKISSGPTGLVKQLDKIDRYESYREAKQRVKQLRVDQDANDASVYKIIFAESELDAEDKLGEKREAPVIQEWEK
jgi:hypothetical protein